MSLDFYIEQVMPTDVYSGNYTHNVCPMWSKAGVYEDLYKSEGKKCKDILQNLKRGYDDMAAKPDEYKKLNPANGWGEYSSALNFLKEIINSCIKYPEGTIHISA